MGPRAGLDRCGKSRPYRDSIPGSPSPVAQSLYGLSYRAHPIDLVDLRESSVPADRSLCLGHSLKKKGIESAVRC